MSPSTQWLSLIAGIAILVYGITMIFQGDWIPFILGILIVAFTVSKMLKTKAAKNAHSDKK
ncbi:MAG: hypothetical protein LLG06_02200 [Desulfobacteraceae bacterium]|nr:hypothetical protein [Desulfobacteraceae bacterium]